MQNINCLADIINHVPRVRVIKEWDRNHERDFNIVSQNHFSKHISVHDGFNTYWYNYSEIQFLTPVQYEWRTIGLGDKVDGREVFDYTFVQWEWAIRAALQGDYRSTMYYTLDEIYSFEPLHKLTQKIDLSTEELVEELKRRWVVTHGNIIH